MLLEGFERGLFGVKELGDEGTGNEEDGVGDHCFGVENADRICVELGRVYRLWERDGALGPIKS